MSIPQKIRASSAVVHEEHYAGELPVQMLPRLTAALADGAGVLAVELQARKVAGYPALTGRIAGELGLVCQRCGKAYRQQLDLAVDLRLVVSDEEEQQLLHHCEPYRVQDDSVPLRELVEDEVLLALPMLPRCDSCENEINVAPETAQADEPRRDEPATGPFAVLKNLKL